jgi:hypothetical protein
VLRFRCGTWSAALTVLFRNLRGRRAARGRALQQKDPGCCKVDAHQGFFSRVVDQRVTDKRRAAIIMRRLRPAVGHDPLRKLAFIKRQCQMAPTFCLGAWAMLVEFADFKQNCTASCKDEA